MMTATATMPEISDDEIAWHEQQHDSWMLADEILADLRALHGLRGDRAATRAAERRIAEKQELLAQRFGEEHGWKRSPSDFSLQCLARGGHHDGNGYRLLSTMLDHPHFYRLDRNAVAVAAHLYNWPANERECRALAAQHGLDVREVTDFPSWCYPGWTKLVLWTGALDRTREEERLEALVECEMERV